MKKFITLNSVAATLFAASGLLAPDVSAGICPSVGDETDCGAVISVGPGGKLSIVNTDGANYGLGTIDSNPYDGTDDALVGVINNSGQTLNSLHLGGTGNGGGIFAFDSDGQQTFVGSGGVAFTPPAPFIKTGYEGPNTAFTNIGTGGTSGDVVFIGGLAAGATRWFSLEGAPDTLAIGSDRRRSFIVDLDSKKATELGNLGGNRTSALGINDAGRVVGQSETSNGQTHAFITGPNGTGPLTDLGTLPGGHFSIAYGVNDLGQVVGQSSTANEQAHAFITGPHGVGMTDLGAPAGGSDSIAFAINNAGQVVGRYEDSNGHTRAFVTGPDGVGIRDLGTLGGAPVVARGINDAGQVVGRFDTNDAQHRQHAFITGPDGGAMKDLGALTPDGSSRAFGIDDDGRVVGRSVDSNGHIHAFITDPNGGAMHDLGTLGGSNSVARGINDEGQLVVGGSDIPGGRNHAFITGPNGTSITDLNSLVHAPGFIFTSAAAINNHGQLVTAAVVPEPEMYAMLLSGLGLIGFLARRRATA